MNRPRRVQSYSSFNSRVLSCSVLLVYVFMVPTLSGLSLTHFFVNAPDGADRDQTVDIRRAVQRVKSYNIFARFARVNRHRVFVLLRDEGAARE